MWTIERKHSPHHDFLWHIADRVVAHLAKHDRVPVYVSEMESWAMGHEAGGGLRILHCHYGYELPVEDWAVLGNLIKQAIGLSCNNFAEWDGLRAVAWAGDLDGLDYDPSKWLFSEFGEYIGSIGRDEWIDGWYRQRLPALPGKEPRRKKRNSSS